MRLTRTIVLVIAGSALLGGTLASPAAAAEARAPDDVCGIEPGDGAFNYVRVWDMRCKHAREVSRKASRKFCGPEFEKCDAPEGQFDRGIVRLNGWVCEMRVGYESYRARCVKDGKRFVHRAGA